MLIFYKLYKAKHQNDILCYGKSNESLVKPCGRVFCFGDALDEYDSLSTKFVLSYDTYNLYRLNNSKMELF